MGTIAPPVSLLRPSGLCRYCSLTIKTSYTLSKYEAFDPEEISGLPEAVRSQLMPNDMGIIAKELEHFWVYHDPGIFINKNFLEKTQGKLLRLSNPPHGRIIKDMAYWHADGFEDVFVEVMKANRGVRFRPLQLCMQDVKSSVITAQNQNDKKKLNQQGMEQKAEREI